MLKTEQNNHTKKCGVSTIITGHKSMLRIFFLISFILCLHPRTGISQNSLCSTIDSYCNIKNVEEVFRVNKNAKLDINKLDSINGYTYTPLEVASLCGCDTIAQTLIKMGADTKIGSPLFMACISGNLELVKILIKSGADIYMKEGKLYPIDVAAQLGYSDILEYLITKGNFEAIKPLTANIQIKGIQELYSGLELYNGEINGLLDSTTRIAMNKYRQLYSSSNPGKILNFSRAGYSGFMDTLIDIYCDKKGCTRYKGGLISTDSGGPYGSVISCDSLSNIKKYDVKLNRIY